MSEVIPFIYINTNNKTICKYKYSKFSLVKSCLLHKIITLIEIILTVIYFQHNKHPINIPTYSAITNKVKQLLTKTQDTHNDIHGYQESL